MLFFILLLLDVACFPSYGINYSISFTGSGASTAVDSVVVQNLTKGTKVTLSAGAVLNLTDVDSDVQPVCDAVQTFRICLGLADGKSSLSFYSEQEGSTQIFVFSAEGRKIAGITTNPGGRFKFISAFIA